MFDILNPQGRGRIVKEELLKDFLSLSQTVERSMTTTKSVSVLRASTSKALQDSRPTSRLPPTNAPPRPTGERPATAKRRETYLYPQGCTEKEAATLNPNMSQNTRSKPANFWLTTSSTGSATTRSLPLLGGRVRSPESRTRVEGSDHHPTNNKGMSNLGSHGLEDASEERGKGSVDLKEAKLGKIGVDNLKHGAVATRKGYLGTENATQDEENAIMVATFSPSMDGHTKNSGAGKTVGHDRRKIGYGGRGDSTNLGTESTLAEPRVHRSADGPLEGGKYRRCSITSGDNLTGLCFPTPTLDDNLTGKDVLLWTAADVLTWIKTLPRGLDAFAEAEAFSCGTVDGEKLANLTLSDLKQKKFHHAKFRAKVPIALWVEIKKIQSTAATFGVVPVAAGSASNRTVLGSSRFSAGETIVDEAVRTPLCTVVRFIGQGAFGEVYEVVWTGVGTDWGTTMAMKAVHLVDISSDERDEYRVILVEEVLTALCVKPHPNVVNVRFAHIMGFCSEREEYLCFGDFVTGRDLEDLVVEGEGSLYDGTAAEDIKSANIMVSNDGQLLVTDFGFATVGQFGPPPLPPVRLNALSAKPSASEEPGYYLPITTARNEAEVTRSKTADGGIRTGSTADGSPHSPNENSAKHARSQPDSETDGNDCAMNTSLTIDTGVSPKHHKYRGSVAGKRQAGTASSAPVTDIRPLECSKQTTATVTEKRDFLAPHGERSQLIVNRPGDGFDNKIDGGGQEGSSANYQAREIGTIPGPRCILFGTLKGFTLRYRSPEVKAIMDKKNQAVASRAGDRIPQTTDSQSPVPGPTINPAEITESFTHRSDMWAAGVVILEMYAGGLTTLVAGRGENARDLLEALVHNSRTGTSTFHHGGARRKCSAQQNCDTTRICKGDNATVDAGEPPTRVRVDERGGTVDSEKWKPGTFRVDMPEDILALMREIFKWKAEERPVSMEVIAARLSQILGNMLEMGFATVPCPTMEAPSPSSLCEKAPAFGDSKQNYSKIGRLHMWLGKALLLKSGNRGQQALEEYRKGVKILEQSKADQGTPSMALFRWYLGKALLEAGEIEEALPHLTEAVSIDPQSAKYRHTLGLIKHVMGDEVGAREDLIKAALLDEEDAEDRCQRRMQRNNEKRMLSTSEENTGRVKKSEEVPPQGTTKLFKGTVAGSTSALASKMEITASKTSNSYSKALETVSITRTYAFEGPGDYRLGKGSTGPGDFGSGGKGTISIGGKLFGDGHVSCVHARRFSVGDEVVCGKFGPFPAKKFGPLRCHPLRNDRMHSGDGTFVIENFLPVLEASLSFSGEFYTVTARQKADICSKPGQSFHLIHIRFESRNPFATSLTASTATPAPGKVPNDTQSSEPSILAKYRIQTSGPGARRSSTSRDTTGVYYHGQRTPSSSPPHSQPLVRSSFMRDIDFVPTLEAVGRAAMVGFHSLLAGDLQGLTWGPRELTIVADCIPSGCLTLREALASSLYKESASAVVGLGNQNCGTAVVVDRMLTLARQIAVAIAHCHSKGVLLQDITPDEVLVTAQWKAILRPNYYNAREGYVCTTIPARKPPLHTVEVATSVLQQESLPSHLVSGDEILTAPFSNTTSSNYQSPEIAEIRRKTQPALRHSGLPRSPKQLREDNTEVTNNFGVGGGQNLTGSFEGCVGSNSAENQSNATSPQHRKGRMARVGNRQGCSESDHTALPVLASSGGGGGCSESTLDVADRSEMPKVTPCTSDIWAWALIVLQMFSDDVWPSGSGQEGLSALESLLLRRQGIDTWTTDDVVSWLHDVELWSEKTEKEIRAFKIAGPQLMVPLCRRDIVEKLGIFITEVDLSQRVWENISGRLQRWAMPPKLANILRRCLADSPSERFSSMKEVCELLRGETRDGRSDGSADKESSRRRSGMILNDIGVCLNNQDHVEEAEIHYKMALLASGNIAEPHFNLGLLYASPAYNNFRQAQLEFETAVEFMEPHDPRVRVIVEHAKAAERKFSYYQSEEIMKALSGKYTGMLPSQSTVGIGTIKHHNNTEENSAMRRPTTIQGQRHSSPWDSSMRTTPPNSGSVLQLRTLDRRSSSKRIPRGTL